ncbi:MAG: protein-export chaperone SecB [Cardiobacteriales bacterium]|nr:MAG: protein-export chaperone SecB [Cardiobacteriales bacterium]
MSEEKQQTIMLEMRKLFTGDLSVEVPHAPDIFQEELNPEVTLSLSHEIRELPPENFYEVKLRLTVTAKDGEKVIYLVELAQSGIFEISGLEEAQLHHALNVYCPTTLYPYAREVVSTSITRAGFPTLFLQPVNFEVLYQQKMQQAAEQLKANEPPKKDDVN